MRHLEVLVVTEKTTKVKVLNWKVSVVNNVEIAIEKLQQRSYKVVAISDEISKTDKSKLQQIINVLFENITVIVYNNDETLAKMIKNAYWNKYRPNVDNKYLDNAFEIQLAYKLNMN